MKVRIVSYTKPSVDLEENGVSSFVDIIAFCARVSNPSNQMNTQNTEKLIKYLASNKHWSPFEMVNVCLEIETTRDIARQILRHRSMSFQEFCLSGDTDIYFAIPARMKEGKYEPKRKYKLKDLYEKWTNGAKPMKERIEKMMIKCYDEEEKKLTTSTIKDIFYTGKKVVYKIILSDGKEIKTTKEHKFLTKDRFLPLENVIGLKLINSNNKITATMTKKTQIAVNGIVNYHDKNNSYIPKWVDIKFIEYLGEEDTYDIEVNHTSHNYIANGIIVHNSQRYANPLKELQFELREARLQDTKNRQNSIEVDDQELQNEWNRRQQEVIDKSTETYQWAIQNGIAKEQARCVLPEGNTLSRLYVNGTLRSWIHYCELRSENGTQKEHAEIAKACAKVISDLFPVVLQVN
jgi:thymidylate synthase ThyX